MTTESESMKILHEEQSAKIETMENNLKNKVKDLYELKSNLMDKNKEFDAQKVQLDTTKSVLEQTEFVLKDVRQSLAEETFVREAHQMTEEQLAEVGSQLITTIGKTVEDVGGLHAKIGRKEDLHGVNRSTWNMSQIEVTDVTSLVDERVDELKRQQEELMATITTKMQGFVKEELEKLSQTQNFLGDNVKSFEVSRNKVSQQTLSAKNEMDGVLEEIKDLRETVKTRVGDGLQGLNTAAERITGEVLSEMESFKSQLHTSYSSMGKEFKSMFEDLMKHVASQKAEIEDLHKHMADAGKFITASNIHTKDDIMRVINDERDQARMEREVLLESITALINADAEMKEVRLLDEAQQIADRSHNDTLKFDRARSVFVGRGNEWVKKENQLETQVAESRDRMKVKMQTDYAVSYSLTTSCLASSLTLS